MERSILPSKNNIGPKSTWLITNIRISEGVVFKRLTTSQYTSVILLP